MHFCIHQILLHSFYHDISLSKVSYAKKKDMGYAKKRKSMPRGMREKMDKCPKNKTMGT
jgi:hypothetical protein